MDKHPGGRPTKFTDELIAKAKSYVYEYESIGSVVPSIVGLCRFIGVARSTLYKWAEESDQFSDMLQEILELQEEKTLNAGLTGDFNSTIAKLVLAKHGYHDKADTTHSGPNGGPIEHDVSFEFIGVDAKTSD